MSIAALIRDMTAAGAPPEAIAIAVDAIEQAQAGIDQVRAAARDRKRRQRERDTSRDTSRDGHATVTGQSRPEPPALDKETLSPTPPIKEINPTPARDTGGPACEPVREEPTPAAVVAKRRWPKDMPPPAGVTDEGWAGFVDHRRAKREPLTPRAYQLFCTKLAKLAEDGWPPGELIDTAVERGWVTVFEPKDTPNAKRSRHDRHDKPSGWAARPGMEGAEPAYLDD